MFYGKYISVAIDGFWGFARVLSEACCSLSASCITSTVSGSKVLNYFVAMGCMLLCCVKMTISHFRERFQTNCLSL